MLEVKAIFLPKVFFHCKKTLATLDEKKNFDNACKNVQSSLFKNIVARIQLQICVKKKRKQPEKGLILSKFRARTTKKSPQNFGYKDLPSNT